jgi:hypothetical protein
LILTKPLLFWSFLVGLSMGPLGLLMGWAAKKVHDRALNDSRWRQVAKVLWSARHVIVLLLASAYPLMLRWYFHADSIFSEWPPQYEWAQLSYAVGGGIAVNWIGWRNKLRTRRQLFVSRGDGSAPHSTP